MLVQLLKARNGNSSDEVTLWERLKILGSGVRDSVCV